MCKQQQLYASNDGGSPVQTNPEHHTVHFLQGHRLREQFKFTNKLNKNSRGSRILQKIIFWLHNLQNWHTATTGTPEIQNSTQKWHHDFITVKLTFSLYYCFRKGQQQQSELLLQSVTKDFTQQLTANGFVSVHDFM